MSEYVDGAAHDQGGPTHNTQNAARIYEPPDPVGLTPAELEGLVWAYFHVPGGAADAVVRQAALSGIVPDHQRAEFDGMVEHPPPDWDEERGVTALERKFRQQEIAQERHEAKKAGPSNWARIDPKAALKAAATPREPEVGRFDGDCPLGVFYSGCINEVHGESESGKTWFVLFVVATELKAGRGVVYVDYEDDEGSVYHRLLLLGVSEETLLGDLFCYHRPNGRLTPVEKVEFHKSVEFGAQTVVFDGVTEGMMLEGLKPRIEDEVAAWHSRITKGLAHAGKCVIVIDHIPHGENHTLGSQHKKSAVTGVSYLVDATAQVGAGEVGKLLIKVEKDRHGSVRRESSRGARPQWRGTLVMDFTDAVMAVQGKPDVKLWPAKPDTGEGPGYEEGPPRLTAAVIAFVKANDGCITDEIRTGVKGRTREKGAAIGYATRVGCIRVEIGANNAHFHHWIRELEGDDQ
jgi:hypothetical protein